MKKREFTSGFSAVELYFFDLVDEGRIRVINEILMKGERAKIFESGTQMKHACS